MKTLDPFFNPLEPQIIEDPFPTYRFLREKYPVYWHQQLTAWVLTRYNDCELVLRDSDLFAADFRRVGIPTPGPILNLQTLDPPEQTPLRHFAMDAVHAQALVELGEYAAHLVHELIEPLAGRDEVDFVHDFADPFTLAIICKLVGAEPPRRDENWARLNDDLDQSMDSELAPGAEARGMAARAAFSSLITEWLSHAPKDGILGYIVRHRNDVEVSDEILVNSVRAFWHAGFEVPSRFLGNTMIALLRRPDAMARLRNGLPIDRAVEELIRFAGPVHALSRACTRATRIGSYRIEKGDVVVALIAAANRDPDQFENPEHLVLERRVNAHLGFGKGPHACLGSQIARIEVRAVLEEVRRWEIQFAGEPVLRSNATLRGPARMPIFLSRPAEPQPVSRPESAGSGAAVVSAGRGTLCEGI